MLLFFTNLIGIAFPPFLYFSVGIKTQKKSQMVLHRYSIIILLGSTIILPLALNYDKFSSGPHFKVLSMKSRGDLFKKFSSHKTYFNTRCSSYNYYWTIPWKQERRIKIDKTIRNIDWIANFLVSNSLNFASHKKLTTQIRIRWTWKAKTRVIVNGLSNKPFVKRNTFI
jgi:hypothetical protein